METTQCPLSAGSVLSQAWQLACRHFPVFLVTFILSYIVSQLSGSFIDSAALMEIVQSNHGVSPEWLADEIMRQFLFGLAGSAIVMMFVSWLLTVYIEVVNYKMYLAAVDYDKPELGDALKTAYKPFLMFLCASGAYSFIVAVGLCLCVLPGIYLAIRLVFVPILAVDRPRLMFGELFSRSWKLTQGHFFDLLLLGVLAVLVNFVGLICCCVGIIFTSIISGFMFALAYRILSPKEDMSVDRTLEAGPVVPTPETPEIPEKSCKEGEDYDRSEK
ncbi:MAG: hypothetical protein K2N13_01950 [Paraprevotella sp.]|nr:hypothetical protein [Paraprevotella sp.]